MYVDMYLFIGRKKRNILCQSSNLTCLTGETIDGIFLFAYLNFKLCL